MQHPSTATDPRDPLQSAVLESFHVHYRTQPENPLLYTLDIPTGTGKSAIFIRMVHEFFTGAAIGCGLPIFVSVNYKLLTEQKQRLRSANIESYLVRSITELNKQTPWAQKHAAIIALHQLYQFHQFDAFPPNLKILLKQTFAPPSSDYGRNPENVASSIREAIVKLLKHLSPNHTPDTWRALLTNKSWYALLHHWAPMQLLAVAPAPVLITGNSFSMRHYVVLPESKQWKLRTWSDLANRMNDWNRLHRKGIEHCILVLDEADALYPMCLDTLSTNLGKIDTVRCLQQFSKFAMWSFIDKMGENHWSFMAPRIQSIIEWLRQLPSLPKLLLETERPKWLLDNADRYKEEMTPGESLFPGPNEYPDWWAHFLKNDYDSTPEHIRQKLFACSELWQRVCAFHKKNQGTLKRITPYDMCKKWLRFAAGCNNILMSTIDYEAYRATIGGIFYSDAATSACGIFDNAYLVAESRRDEQYNLTLSPIKNAAKDGHLSFVEYLQMIRAMHRCVTDSNWEWRSEVRDANQYRDLFDYIYKFQGRFSQSLPEKSIDIDAFVTDLHVYASTKSKTDLHQAPMAQHQSMHTQAININVLQTMGSPELELTKWLNAGHTVVLSSATVGLPGVYCGTYNVSYIVHNVQEKRTLVQSRLSEEGQKALAELHDLYNQQHTVITTIINESEPSMDSTDWVDIWMAGLSERGLLDRVRNNAYTTRTRNNAVRMLGEFIWQRSNSGLIMQLTNKDIQPFVNALVLQLPNAVEQTANLENTYRIDVHELCRWLLLDPTGLPSTIRIALYDRAWRDQFEHRSQIIQEADVFETQDTPLLLFSAFGSADRGINFAFTHQRRLIDLDFLALACDPYYGGNLLKDEEDLNEILRWQEFLKITASQEQPGTVLDAALAYPSDSFHALAPVVSEKNVQTVIQVIGRAYRYGTSGTTRVYLTAESAASLRDVYHRWNLEERGSHVLKQMHTALVQIQPSAWTKTPKTPTIEEYCQVQFLLAKKIDTTVQRAIANMRQGGDRAKILHTAWERLRRVSLYEKNFQSHFTTIEKDLAVLGLPSPFLHVPQGDLVYAAKMGQETYLTDATDPNATKRPYRWQQFLAQDGILSSLAKSWRHPNRFPQSDTDVYIQPWFVQRFIRGVLGEYLVLNYAAKTMAELNASMPDMPWVTLPSLKNLALNEKDEHALIEMADLFFYNAATKQLLAIDAKYWGVEQDRRKGPAIIADAKRKQKKLQATLQLSLNDSCLEVSYALVNATSTKVWQSSHSDNIYVCAATINPKRDGTSWKYNPKGPFPLPRNL